MDCKDLCQKRAEVYVVRVAFDSRFLEEREGLESICPALIQRDETKVPQSQVQLLRST